MGAKTLADLRSVPGEAMIQAANWGNLNFGLDGYLLSSIPAQSQLVPRFSLTAEAIRRSID